MIQVTLKAPPDLVADSRALGEVLADAILAVADETYKVPSKDHGECIGSVMSVLTGETARLYGADSAINFCRSAISLLLEDKVKKEHPEFAKELGSPMALGDNLIITLLAELDRAHSPNTEASRICLNYVLGGLAAVLGGRYGDEAVIRHCNGLVQLASEELAKTPKQ